MLGNIKEMSLKNFISDIPRIFNTLVKELKGTITSFFNESDNKITIKSLESTTISATSVNANDVYVTTNDGNTVSVSSIIEKMKSMSENIEDLKERVKKLEDGE